MSGRQSEDANGNNRGEKLSGAMRIFQALSAVDEELVERSAAQYSAAQYSAAQYSAARSVRFRKDVGALVACLCLCVIGAALWAGNLLLAPYGSDAPAEMAAIEENTDSDGVDLSAEEAPEDAELQEEAAAVAAESSVTAEDSGMSGAAAADKLQGENEMSANRQNGAGDAGAKQDGISDTADQNVWDRDVAQEECVSEEVSYISEEEARNTRTLGDYLPTALPEGYRFESAGRCGTAEAAQSVWVRWQNGMDDIVITVLRDGAASLQGVLVADTSRPETYDVRLYETPYAETVPEEYREIFDNPVFAAGDLTREVVRARMQSVSDRGDTDTPRGNFSVLYENGVMVKFSGRGDAESIWEMFESVQGYAAAAGTRGD